MKYPTAALPLMATQMFFDRNMYPADPRNSNFKLPDIPENERIKVKCHKIRKHGTKRRINKLHDRRRER